MHERQRAAIARRPRATPLGSALYAASDLVAYPKDSRPGSPSDLMTRLGLADAKPEGAPSRAKREGRATTATRETAKLRAANSIAKKYPNWRELGVVSPGRRWLPWLDHTAAAALTGARPEELRAAQIYERTRTVRSKFVSLVRRYRIRKGSSGAYSHSAMTPLMNMRTWLRRQARAGRSLTFRPA